VGLSVETRGGGPVRLVLVHGFTQTARSWEPVAAPLAADHEVVLVDAPGHGGSSAIETDLPDGALALVEAAGTGIYVGYSMGARLCLHAALAAPSHVTGLVLLGGNPGIEDTGERAARVAADDALAAGIERDGVDAFLDRWLAQPLFATLPNDAAGVEDRRRNTAAGLASSLRLAGTGTHDLWDRLGRIAAPTLVLAGEHDEKFTAIGRRIAERIGPGAVVATVPGAGHAAHLEQPAAFVAIVRQWLAGQAVSQTPSAKQAPKTS
jgi:2-succinyl-6-hydroxy-2,4-cyclohexadiene-1-carboxylate synthase